MFIESLGGKHARQQTQCKTTPLYHHQNNIINIIILTKTFKNPMKKIILLLFSLFCFALLQAQNTRTIETKVEVTKAKYLGKTLPVRNLAVMKSTDPQKRQDSKKNKRTVPNFPGAENEKHKSPTNPNALPKDGDPVRQSVNYKNMFAPVELLVNVDGIDQDDAFVTPPDPSGDIGKDYYVHMVNATTYQVFDKNGNEETDPISLNTLWAEFNLSGAGDPIVFYDQEYEKWFMSEFTQANHLLIAISETSDPLGAWKAYSFLPPSFPDYPKYAIWKDVVYVTTNEFDVPEYASYFFDRHAMFTGEEDVQMQRVLIPSLNNIDGVFTTTPVDWTGNTPPPVNANPIILRMNDDLWGNTNSDEINLYTIDIDFDNPSNTSLSVLDLTTAPFSTDMCADPGPGFECIPQLNGNGIEAMHQIIMHQVHYRNFETHESIVLNFVVNAGTNNNKIAGVRWMELRRSGDTDWEIYQEGTFAPDDGLHRFMGSIATDRKGNIALAYAVTSPEMNPGLRLTGRMADDPLGEMTLEETLIIDGSSAVSFDRYGDYAQMTVDPINNRTFWFTGEYMQDFSDWGTRVTSFEFFKDSVDFAPYTVESPASSPELTEEEMVSVSIRNYGLNTENLFNIGYIFEGGTAIIEEINQAIEPDEIYTHTFTDLVDMSEVGDYQFKFFTNINEDEVPLNDTINRVISKLPYWDAGISRIEGLSSTTCDQVIPIEIRLSNYGQEDLTSATIQIDLNGDDFETINWTGNLDPGESELIPLNISNLQDEENIIVISSSEPNGENDQIPENDAFETSFEFLLNSKTVNFELLTDNYPAETSWVLEDESGNTIYESPTYSAQQTLYTEDWCLAPGVCYSFTIFDTFGDGISYQGVSGYYTITDSEGEELANIIDVSFGSVENNSFCTDALPCNLSVDIDTAPTSAEDAEDGTIMINPLNGVAPFEYSIDGGESFQDSNVFDNLTAGDYEVVVQGQTDCYFEDAANVSFCTLIATAQTVNETVTGEKDGQLSIDIEGGTPPYNVSIDNFISGSNTEFDNFYAGTYTVTIKDAGDCEIVQEIEIGYDTASGVNEIVIGHQIEVTPNPTNGVFRINLRGMENQTEVFIPLKVYDSTGQRIQNGSLVKYDEIFTTQLSLVAYPAGVYYVRFEGLDDLVRVVKY